MVSGSRRYQNSEYIPDWHPAYSICGSSVPWVGDYETKGAKEVNNCIAFVLLRPVSY